MTTEEIYTEIRELIVLLRNEGHDKLVGILEHRMFKVSWTSSSELLENISFVLTGFIREQQGNNIGHTTEEKMKSIIQAIELSSNESMGSDSIDP